MKDTGFDTCVQEFKGKKCFRPQNHPLGSVVCCKKCKQPTVSLPCHMGDYFDCESCGHSWPMTSKQVDKMRLG